MKLWFFSFLILASASFLPDAASLYAQQSPPLDEASTASEVVSHDEPTTFRSGVNLVMIPVVVRDSSGKAVGNLRKEDFQLSDRGKPQEITKFSMETAGGRLAKYTSNESSPLETANDKTSKETIAERYTVFLFDDIHATFEDLARARDAAGRHIDSSFLPTDRAAIFTTSGQNTLNFTDDRTKIHQALLRLQPRPIASAGGAFECPRESYYMADLIENKHDQQAFQAATQEALVCLHLDPTQPGSLHIAQQAAQNEAISTLPQGEQETRISFLVIKDAIRRLSILPGQRNIVFVSPGFLTPDDLRSDEYEVLDRAVRANVTISSLDARGLYTVDAVGDISQSSVGGPDVTRLKAEYDRLSASVNSDLLIELAHGTGGAVFQNNNDLGEGFRRLATPPEYVYLLGFSPQNLKPDGAFHQVKVKINAKGKFDLQARKGYFAPKRAADAQAAAKERIEEALFSRDEMHDLPIDLQTQFFKSSDTEASVSVLAKVTLKQIHFRKQEGRNWKDLTIVAALFDRDGNFVKANEKTLQMRIKDATLARTPALTVKTSFDVPPGSYMVRLVVRDTEGEMMTAENGSVEIPY